MQTRCTVVKTTPPLVLYVKTTSFPLTADDIIALCDEVQPLFEAECTLLQLSAPIKIFGDIHGQYADLLRYFGSFGSPAVDVEYVSYLFLGDYVDRGTHSLEVLVLDVGSIHSWLVPVAASQLTTTW